MLKCGGNATLFRRHVRAIWRTSSCQQLYCHGSVAVKSFWQGEPQGELITYEGSKAYVGKPKEKTHKAVLFIPDIFGIDLVNNRLLVDYYAQKGFLTVLPDYFADHPVPIKEMQSGQRDVFMKWIETMSPDLTIPFSEKFLKYLKSEGATSIGVAGYCWGGGPGSILATKDQIKALVVNHGSFIKDETVKEITKPSMFNGSDNDPHISRERFSQLEQIIKNNKVPQDFKFFDGAPHGWTCKGDENDPKKKEQIVDAFDRGISWFNKYL